MTRTSEAKILQDNARSLRLDRGPGIVGDASLASAPGADLSLSAGILSLNNTTSISISLFLYEGIWCLSLFSETAVSFH